MSVTVDSVLLFFGDAQTGKFGSENLNADFSILIY
jgi:hypothetical protein